MKAFDFPQYSAEWWSVRRGIPTASEFHRIITPKNWSFAEGRKSYINQLIADTYNHAYGQHEGYVSNAMAAGSYVEPEARRYYEFAQGGEVKEVGFVQDDQGQFGCSPDALVGEDGGLELKHPELKTHVKWLLAGGVPSEHLAQCHGFLVVTGRKWIDFLSYCPPLPHLLVRVEANEKTEQLRECLGKFWIEYQDSLALVKSLHEPEPTKVLDFGSMGTVEITAQAESYF